MVKTKARRKRCGKCGELKTEEEFSRNRTKPDGLDYWCKECAVAYYRHWPRREEARHDDS